MPAVRAASQKNQILNSLSDEAMDRLRPHLSLVDLPLGKVLFGTGRTMESIYFPTGSMVSIIGYTEEGQRTEIGVVGWEGLAGIEALLGAESSMNEYVVQLPNGGLQCKTSLLLEEFNHCGSLHTAVLNFTRKFMAQVSQTALCNRLHPLVQRLARWLLMCDDRSHSNELELTQEFLGIMAGSTRASVTLVAITLKSAGFIAYTRGKITIVDRAGLEDFSCECYRLVKDIYDG